MPDMLVTYADTAVTEAHWHELLAEADDRRIMEAAFATRSEEGDLTTSGRVWHPHVAFPADAWTTLETGPAMPSKRRTPHLHLGSTSEWLRWLRTYVLLWLAGVVFYLLLAAGTFIAGGFLAWSP